MIHETDNKYIKWAVRAPMVQGNVTFANEVCSDIEVLKPEAVEESLYKFKASGDKFAPVPELGKYVNIEEDCTCKLYDEMVISPYEEVVSVLHILYQYPFVLVDHRYDSEFHIFDKYEEEKEEPLALNDPENVLDYDEAIEEFPSIEEEFYSGIDDRYGIITLSDINKRQIRDVFYPAIAEFEQTIARKIREEYPCSEDLTEVVGRDAARAWEKNRDTHAEVHISEFMNLKDMELLISDSRSLATACGFEVESQINDLSEAEELRDLRALSPKYILTEIRNLRNKTMHANRALVHDVDDLVDIINQYNYLCAFIDEISDQMHLSEPVTGSKLQ